MRFLVICLFLFVGCNSTEKRLVEISSELAELRSRVDEAKKHGRYLEDEQDDIVDAIDGLVGGQKLIELGPCDKCVPVEDFPPIFMGPWPPGEAPR
jgi:hypothetical protein